MLFIFKITSNCSFSSYLEAMDFKSSYSFKFENFNIKGYVGGFKENTDICALILLQPFGNMCEQHVNLIRKPNLV